MPVAQTVTAPPAQTQTTPSVTEGERGVPAPAATTENWQRPKFGNMVAGEVTNTKELKDEFKKSIQVIAEQLRNYATTGAELTDEQKRFLDLYKLDNGVGDKMLETEDGAVVVHLMAEQEVFLRLAALKKQVELVRTGHLDSSKVKNEFTVDELQGLVRKHGKEVLAVIGGVMGVTTDVMVALLNPVAGVALIGAEATAGASVGIVAAVKSAMKTGKFKISDLATIDTSQLPDKYKGYVDYIAHSTVAQQGVNDFVFNEGIRIKKFYKALGVDEKHLNHSTPWSRLNIGATAPVAGISADMASQNVLTDWMIFRADRLASKGAIAGGDVPAVIAKKYFEAHVETIQHYIGYEIGRIRGEQRSSAETSLTQMKATRDKMKSPSGLAEKKAKKQTELDKAKQELTTKEAKLETAKERVTVLTEERARYAVAQAPLDTEYDNITHGATGFLKKVQDEIDLLVHQKDVDAGNFDASWAGVPAGADQAIMRTEISRLKSEAIAKYEDAIEKKKAREQKLLTRKGEIETERTKEADRVAELARRNGEVVALTPEISKLKKTTIPGLERQVKSGLSPKEQKQLNQLEASVRALERYDTVFSDLTNADTKNLGVNQLLNIAPEDEGGVNYPNGYLRALKLIFNYEHPPEGVNVKDFFEAATARLPQTKLAEILAKYFDMPIPVLGPFGFVHPGSVAATIYPDALSYTMDYVRLMKKPSQNVFNQAFFSVMDTIEHEGLRFK